MNLRSAVLACAVVAFAGCGNDSRESGASDSNKAATEAASLPEGFFLKDAPADALPVGEARLKAKTGETIALTGYIGGREQPFTDGRAIFLVADAEKAPACGDGDACKTAWDACCVPSDQIAANSATVQVVDAEGRALRVGLNGQGGLAPGAKVTVIGKVREASEGVLIVDASGVALAARQGEASN